MEKKFIEEIFKKIRLHFVFLNLNERKKHMGAYSKEEKTKARNRLDEVNGALIVLSNGDTQRWKFEAEKKYLERVIGDEPFDSVEGTSIEEHVLYPAPEKKVVDFDTKIDMIEDKKGYIEFLENKVKSQAKAMNIYMEEVGDLAIKMDSAWFLFKLFLKVIWRKINNVF